MIDRGPESLGGLPRQCTSGGIGNGTGNHYRQADILLIEILLNRKQRRLGIQCIKDGFHQNHIRAAIHQAAHRFSVGFNQLIESHITVAGIIHIRRNRRGAIGGTQYTGDKTRFVGSGHGIRRITGQSGTFVVQFIHQRFHAVVGHGNRGAVKGIGLDDIGTRF